MSSDTVKKFASIKVVGIGGGGGNAVNRMVAESVQGVEFIAANTDLQAIGVSLADNKIQLGAKLAKGLGGIAVTPIGKCVYSLEPDKIANSKYKLPISQKDAKTIVLSVIERLSKSTGEDSISDYFFNVLDQNYHEVHIFLNLIFFNLDYFVGILVTSHVWKTIGWSSIIYLAAMSSIDPALYESARIDGANRLQMAWHITLPSIMFVIVIMFLLEIGNLLEAGFEQILLLYSPSVYKVADIIDTFVYREGLLALKYSFAAAVGLFKAVIAFFLLYTANRLANRLGQTGLW